MSSINGSAQIQDGTAAGLLQFLDYVVAKGYGRVSAVSPWRSATRQVLSTVEKTDDIGDVNVRELDLEDYLDRFEMLAKGDLKVESIQAYRRRFTNAHQAYVTFLETNKPPSFRQQGAKRSKAEQPAAAPTAKQASQPAVAAAPGSTPPEERMIDYPFPLRSGQVASLRLPVRFEKADAERLASFVRTLVFEQMLELNRGSEEEPDSTRS